MAFIGFIECYHINRPSSPPPTQLFNISFDGDRIRTTVTRDPTSVSNWISEIESLYSNRRRDLIVGLDVEWRPTFSREQNPVATVQLCVGHRCLIFQILHAPYVPDSLVSFFSVRDYTFVGVGVKNDLNKLKNEYGFGGRAYAVELGRLAAEEYGRKELKNSGLKNLASLVLGKELQKRREVTLSRWDSLCLSDEQVKYACLDAFVSSEIGRSLNASNY